MIMDCEKYVGKCVCGRDHELETKKVVVEYGAINNFEQYMADVSLAGKKRAVIYDTVIYKLTEGKHVAADQEIVLEANGLRAEDTVIEEMMKKLDNPEVIVAYGAGTIMDFGRYPAYKLGIPFVAIPTLASSDGFTANICSAILNGQKKSTPMCAPVLVVADLDIIKGAPARLVASGINDILSKYISLFDWKVSHLVAGEYYCPMVADLAQEALDIMREAADKYAATMSMPGGFVSRESGTKMGIYWICTGFTGWHTTPRREKRRTSRHEPEKGKGIPPGHGAVPGRGGRCGRFETPDRGRGSPPPQGGPAGDQPQAGQTAVLCAEMTAAAVDVDDSISVPDTEVLIVPPNQEIRGRVADNANGVRVRTPALR